MQPVIQIEGWREGGGIGFVGDGIAVNSPLIDGLPTPQAKRKIIEWLSENGLGSANVNYKLRDWLFSRQRYWGEPFPVVWEDGQHRALGEDELPIVPPATVELSSVTKDPLPANMLAPDD